MSNNELSADILEQLGVPRISWIDEFKAKGCRIKVDGENPNGGEWAALVTEHGLDACRSAVDKLKITIDYGKCIWPNMVGEHIRESEKAAQKKLDGEKWLKSFDLKK